MKLNRFFLTTVLAFVLVTVTVAAQAAEAARALIYIGPQHYAHETLLRHYYLHYWFSQGEVLEPIALEALKPVLGKTAMCQDNSAADVVVMLTPKMFYNPYASIFYGKISARVFSGGGSAIANYQAKVEQWGFLDVLPEQPIKATYRAAMADIVRQMQLDPGLQTLLAQGLADGETRMPCGLIAALPAQKQD